MGSERKKCMKLVVATENKGKVEEFKRIFSAYGIEVSTPREMGFSLDVEETGTTFMENAYIKAKYASEKTGYMAVADDSGLCIEAFPELLGVYSARFMGEDTSYIKKNAKILSLMESIPEEKRTAWYECAICLVVPHKKETLNSVGKCYGKIGYEPKGENGFGYDPIFYIGDESFAEISGKKKDSLSHRGNALKDFMLHLENFLGK